MKKLTLHILNWIAYLGTCAGAGYLLGRIAGWLITKIGVNEEFAEAHPWRTTLLVLLAWILIVLIPGYSLVTFVFVPILNWFDSKIEAMDDEDPFDK